jgi:AraC family L-rhamnose operon transcriptional activator RhaR
MNSRGCRRIRLLGYLLWSGPYAMERRGLLTVQPAPDALDACVEHLAALERLRSGAARGDIIGRLSLLLATLRRAAAGNGRDAADSSGAGHLAVVQALRLMEASLAYPWTLKEIADRLHLAPGYLARIFKSATGVPPMTYLSRFRAETATAMLLDTDLPVTQICRSVGWPDPSNFARRFKSHFGMAASTYRSKSSRLEKPPRAEARGGSGVAGQPMVNEPVSGRSRELAPTCTE